MTWRSTSVLRNCDPLDAALTLGVLTSFGSHCRSDATVTRRLPYLIDQAEITKWADRMDARAEFPRLIRSLISATNDRVVSLQMRAAEGIDARGYDGTSEAQIATPFVPAGVAVWELGVGLDPGDKAQRDYRTRTDDPLGVDCSATTFVFATPRKWDEKEAWASRKREEGIWADVKAFDVDDIGQALELAPGVHHRFSEIAGKPSYGAQSLQTWWEKFRRLSSPSLDPAMVLAGRADEAAELLRVFDSSPQQVTVSAVSTDEMLAFVASSVLSTDEDIQRELLDRALIVKDSYTLSYLEQYSDLLILIPYDGGLRREARLVHEHHVVVRAEEGWDPTIKLGPVDRAEVQSLLVKSGVPQDRAEYLARCAYRSIEAFQRAAAVPGKELSPAWADLLETPLVRRCWLAGRWDERRSGDRDALAALLGQEYEMAREHLVALTKGADPMMVVVGSTWKVVSLEDTWRFGQPRLQPSDLDGFEILIQVVLGEVDPRLELPIDKRWMAAVHGKTRLHSSDLRSGVADVLALLGARGDEVSIGSGTVGGWLRNAVRKLLTRANDDTSGHLWASLADVMPLLAEAAPDVFLDAVQRRLQGEPPLLGLMFADHEGDFLTVSSPHTGLLWALECLAWSPEHFPLAVEHLARLAEMDPGGRLSNRPAASLADIFWPWLPQTSVSLDTRLRALDGLRDRHPTVSWRLLMSMIPESHSIGGYTYGPRYRGWKPVDAKTYDPERIDSWNAAALRAVTDAGMDPDRWAELVTRFDDLPLEAFDAAVLTLEGLGVAEVDIQVRATVWEPLHALVQRHRRYADKNWAMPPERVDQLDALQQQLAPDDARMRIQWLFDDHLPDLPEEASQDFEADRYLEAVIDQRSRAIIELVRADGIDGVRALARAAEYPGFVGAAVADSGLDNIGRALLEDIDSEDPKLATAAQAWATRKGSDDQEWVAAIALEFTMRPQAQARVLQVGRDLEAVWAMAAEDEAVDAAYWAEFSPYGRGQEFELANEAARRLLDHDRPRAALALMSMYGRSGSIDPILIVEGLEALLAESEDQMDRVRVDGHDLETLLDLAREADVSTERLALLEWALRPALGFEAHSPTLERKLAEDPGFFVEVLSMAFRGQPDDESKNLPEQLAQNAYRLLDEWSVIPGTDEAGAIERDALDGWVDEAMRLADQANRLGIALDRIGRVLARSPSDPDGSWPAQPVRRLIERVSRSELDDGFAVQILNRRGVQSRGLSEGGNREREIAAQYATLADRVGAEAPRTAAALRSVAASYEAHARLVDEQAERFNEGLDL